MFRVSPPEYGISSSTIFTSAPSRRMRRAMIRPISPDPKITDRSARHISLDVDKPLCSACCKHARRPVTRYHQRTAAPLAAAHRQHDGVRLDHGHPGIRPTAVMRRCPP